MSSEPGQQNSVELIAAVFLALDPNQFSDLPQLRPFDITQESFMTGISLGRVGLPLDAVRSAYLNDSALMACSHSTISKMNGSLKRVVVR